VPILKAIFKIGDRKLEIEVKENLSVLDALKILGINREAHLIVKNGLPVDDSSPLTPGVYELIRIDSGG